MDTPNDVPIDEEVMKWLQKFSKDPELSREVFLLSYLGELDADIKSRAKDLAGKDMPSTKNLAQAAFEYAPGKSGPMQKGWGERIWTALSSLFSSIIFLSALLAVTFGILGLSGAAGGGDSTTTQGFLDIAKIFAGAVVGSAGASAVAESS